MVPSRSILAAGVLAALAPLAVQADMLRVRVTVQSLVPAGSIAFAPLHVGFHGGSFDAFDEGSVASAAIVSVAEGGSGAEWFPAFAAADPGATLGTVLPMPAGPLLPGGGAYGEFRVDPRANPFFTFAAMVVPSNDYFIGNDDPRQYRLFDADGTLRLEGIDLLASDIWDAGSELDDPLAAAFLMIGNNDLRTPQGGLTSLDFEGLAIFDGLQTAAGYEFRSGLTAGTGIYRIRFEAVEVPEPGPLPLALAGLGLLAISMRRRRTG